MVAKGRCDQTNNIFSAELETLQPGTVPLEYIELLFRLTKSSSIPLRDAVIDHLCNGTTQLDVAPKYSVAQGSVSRLIKRLDEINKVVCELSKYHS